MKTESRFDTEAARWDDNPQRVALARAVGMGIRRVTGIKPGWRILDYGAGTGLMTLHLQPEAEMLIAVDQSEGMLKMLKSKIAAADIGNVQTKQWNIEKSPLPEGGFDLVASSMTFHHLRNVPMVVQRLALSLKPGGWIALADLDIEDGSFHGPSNDVFHLGFDRSKVRKSLSKAGFKDITIEDVYVLNKPDKAGKMHSYSVFLAAGHL